jgi:hypothetical protein
MAMTSEDKLHPFIHRQPMGVNGLPDDYIDDSDREDAVGGSRDEREPQPISSEGIAPLTDSEADKSERADSVVKLTHGE